MKTMASALIQVNYMNLQKLLQSTYVKIRNSDTVRGSLRRLWSILGMLKYMPNNAIANVPKMQSATIVSNIVKGNSDIRIETLPPLPWLGGICWIPVELEFITSSVDLAASSMMVSETIGKGLVAPGSVRLQCPGGSENRQHNSLVFT